jgi:hypothetical protein
VAEVHWPEKKGQIHRNKVKKSTSTYFYISNGQKKLYPLVNEHLDPEKKTFRFS